MYHNFAFKNLKRPCGGSCKTQRRHGSCCGPIGVIGAAQLCATERRSRQLPPGARSTRTFGVYVPNSKPQTVQFKTRNELGRMQFPLNVRSAGVVSVAVCRTSASVEAYSWRSVGWQRHVFYHAAKCKRTSCVFLSAPTNPTYPPQDRKHKPTLCLDAAQCRIG